MRRPERRDYHAAAAFFLAHRGGDVFYATGDMK